MMTVVAESSFGNGYTTAPDLAHEDVWNMTKDHGFSVEVGYQESLKVSL